MVHSFVLSGRMWVKKSVSVLVSVVTGGILYI